MTPTPKTIKQGWEDFSKDCKEVDAAEEEAPGVLNLMRSSFYGGAIWMFFLITKHNPYKSGEACSAFLNDVQDAYAEIQEYRRRDLRANLPKLN
jgi:hypothetical protein